MYYLLIMKDAQTCEDAPDNQGGLRLSQLPCISDKVKQFPSIDPFQDQVDIICRFVHLMQTADVRSVRNLPEQGYLVMEGTLILFN